MSSCKSSLVFSCKLLGEEGRETKSMEQEGEEELETAPFEKPKSKGFATQFKGWPPGRVNAPRVKPTCRGTGILVVLIDFECQRLEF